MMGLHLMHGDLIKGKPSDISGNGCYVDAFNLFTKDAAVTL